MGLESATKIAELNPLWPLGTDGKAQGDDHIRMLKAVLQANDGGAITGFRRTSLASSGTYTKPSNLKFLVIEVVGGGGASGGTGATTSAQSSVGAGGGAGGYCWAYLSNALVPASQVYTVGAGGVGVSGATGGGGGLSQFGTFGTSGGGGGGQTAIGTTGGAAAGIVGGAGGTAVSGQFVFAGEPGGNSLINVLAAGYHFIGGGGSNPVGVGVKPMMGGSVVRANGIGFGAGGRAPSVNGSTPAQVGGDAGPGVIILTEYF